MRGLVRPIGGLLSDPAKRGRKVSLTRHTRAVRASVVRLLTMSPGSRPAGRIALSNSSRAVWTSEGSAIGFRWDGPAVIGDYHRSIPADRRCQLIARFHESRIVWCTTRVPSIRIAELMASSSSDHQRWPDSQECASSRAPPRCRRFSDYELLRSGVAFWDTQGCSQNGYVLTREDRTRKSHCPVCGARLRWNMRSTRRERCCTSCSATLQTTVTCRRCGTARIWRGAGGSYCHGCGHEYQP